MFLLGVLFMTVSALAQPTVLISRSSIAYPSYRVYLDAASEVAIVKEAEESKLIPEAPVLEPLPIEKSVELELEQPNDVIEEKKDEELEHKTEEELKEEVLKEEGPEKVELEDDKKVVILLDEPKPPSFITSIISAFPIKLPHFELPFNLGSLWNKKEKTIRLVPAYAFV